jgi:hypothetical protein
MKLPILKLLTLAKVSSVPSLLVVAAGLVVPALAARVSRGLAEKGYKAWAHEDPPENPEDPALSLRHAIAWTIISGTVGGLSRLLAGRLLASRPRLR